MPVIASLVVNPVPMFELSVACEVFGLDRTDLGMPPFEHRVCAAVPGPLRSPEGIGIDAPFGLEGVLGAELVLVPGWPVDLDVPDEVCAVLRRAHDSGARVMSFCSGLFALGAAGLIDGRPCATHWAYAEEFQRRYPHALVDPNVLYIDDGDILTSAGTAAGIDLCLHLVRKDYGAEVANAVARRMVVPPHRDGGQAQFVTAAVPACHDEGIAPLLAWLEEHLDEQHTVADLARHLNVSPRTFARRFRDATGTTPHQWLLRQRISLAQRMLEGTDEPIEEVARRTGFGSAAALRVHFTRFVAASPNSYRRAFRSRRSA